MAVTGGVAILDFGGQSTQILARTVRELGVYSAVLPGDATQTEMTEAFGELPAAIIVAGGPQGPRAAIPAHALKLPVLHLESGQEVCPKQLERFLFEQANLTPVWNLEGFIEHAVQSLREKVGSAKVISALSGGVDSSVATALVAKAVGENLSPIMVDHGLLRQGEAEDVCAAFAKEGVFVRVIEAQDLFYERLRGVTDPETKRKIIGASFIEVFQREARKLGAKYMVQGTIYPDVLESGSRTRQAVKSHHNVGGLPEELDLLLLEPLRELFKSEVREVGEILGLPSGFLNRHPFPGPGFAVRVLGEVTVDKVSLVRAAQSILDEEIHRAGHYGEVWQCFCVLPGVLTVGTTGEARTYGHLMALRAVHSNDAVTASWARLPYELLERVSTRITGEIPGVNRVVYDITAKPPSTIEWE